MFSRYYHVDQRAPATALGRYLRVRPFYCSTVVSLFRWAKSFSDSSQVPYLGNEPKHWQYIQLAYNWMPRIPGAVLYPHELYNLHDRAEALALSSDGLWRRISYSHNHTFGTAYSFSNNSNSLYGSPRLVPFSTYYGNAYPFYLNALQAQSDATKERVAKFFVKVRPVFDDIKDSPANSLGNGQVYVSGDTWLDESGMHFEPNVVVHGESSLSSNYSEVNQKPKAISTSRKPDQLSVTVCPVKTDLTDINGNAYSSQKDADLDSRWQNSTPVLPFSMVVVQARWKDFIDNRLFLCSGSSSLAWYRRNLFNNWNARNEDRNRLINEMIVGGWFSSQNPNDPSSEKTLTVCARQTYGSFSSTEMGESINSQCIFSSKLPAGDLPDTFSAMTVGAQPLRGDRSGLYGCGGMPNENVNAQVLKETAADYIAPQEVTFLTGSTLNDNDQTPTKVIEPGFYNCYPVNDATWGQGTHTKENIAYVQKQDSDGNYVDGSEQAKVFSNQINYHTSGHLPINVGDSKAPVSDGSAKAGGKTINGCSVRFIEIEQETIEEPTEEILYGLNHARRFLPPVSTLRAWGWRGGNIHYVDTTRFRYGYYGRNFAWPPYEQREPPGYAPYTWTWNLDEQYPPITSRTDISSVTWNSRGDIWHGTYTVQDQIYDYWREQTRFRPNNDEFLVDTVATFSQTIPWVLNYELYQWMVAVNPAGLGTGDLAFEQINTNANEGEMDDEQLAVLQTICPKMIQGTYQFTPFNHEGIDSNENLFRCISSGPSVDFEHSIPLQLWTDNGPSAFLQTLETTQGELNSPPDGEIFRRSFPNGEPPDHPGTDPRLVSNATPEEIDAYDEAFEAWSNWPVTVEYLPGNQWQLGKGMGHFKTTGTASTTKVEAYCQLGWSDAKDGVYGPIAEAGRPYDRFGATSELERNRPPSSEYTRARYMSNDLNLYNNITTHDDGTMGGIPVLSDDDFKPQLTVNIAMRSEHSLDMTTEFAGASGVQITKWPHTLNPSENHQNFGSHTYFSPGGGHVYFNYDDDSNPIYPNQYANIKGSQSFSPLSFGNYWHYQANLTCEQTEIVLNGGEVTLDPILQTDVREVAVRSHYGRQGIQVPKYQVAISLNRS
jgi:hypothetical protein